MQVFFYSILYNYNNIMYFHRRVIVTKKAKEGDEIGKGKAKLPSGDKRGKSKKLLCYKNKNGGNIMYKKLKKLMAIAVIATLAIVEGLLPIAAEATVFSGGAGTAENPYLISTAEDLVKLSALSLGESAADYNGKYYKVTADIDMNGVADFKGIGWGTHFSGVFDGDYHSVKNLTFSSDGFAGFFNLADGATIKNFGLENLSISGNISQGMGGFIGRNFNSNGTTTIENCYVRNITLSNSNGSNAVGAFVGNEAVAGIVIKNCYSAQLSGTGIQGLVGNQYGAPQGGSTISNCYSTGNPWDKFGTADPANTTNVYKITTSATAEQMTGLGSAFVADIYNLNNGLPVLSWEKPSSGGEGGENPDPVPVSMEYFVAPDGSDSNPGTIDKPFATIEKARNTVRAMIARGLGADSGTADCPVVYRAYNGETVNLYGSKELNASKITKVTDETLLNRLIEAPAREHLYQLDLNTLGITAPELKYNGENGKSVFYMNGVALTNARWPNADKSGEQYFVKAQGAELTADEKGKYNGANQPVKMQYVDSENRSQLWEIKPNDLYIGGAFAYLWRKQTLKVATIDTENKVFKTSNPSQYGQNTHTSADDRYLYFENLFEEIDVPGESYLDRENNILYFYPVGDVENATMSLSTLNSTMIYNEGASYVTYDGLNIKESCAEAMVIGGSSTNVIVQNATINGIGGYGIRVYGQNSTVQNCDLYDISNNAIFMRGGNRETLTPSGSILKNNTVHSASGTADAVDVGGCGHVIAHNKFYEYDMGAIRSNETNNILVEYNEFYDCQLLNADGGVLYFGRNVTELGNIIRYNYFHDIGNLIGQHGQQSIFTDDGEPGPFIYGNIFYRGGLPSFPIKTHAGQFHWISNNIIIDNSTGAFMQEWPAGETGSTEGRQGRWWLYIQDKGDLHSANGTGGWWAQRKDLLLSDKWIKYYTEDEPTGQWKGMYDYLNGDICAKLDTLYAQEDKEKAKSDITSMINSDLPVGPTNRLYNNVFINVDTVYEGGNVDVKNNITKTLNEGKNLFENYGTDFTLTSQGLAEIRSQIPDFEDPNFKAMGLEESATKETDPTASDLRITGLAGKGSTLTANYTFNDENGHTEGLSKITWYQSKTADGEYKRITRGYGEHFVISSEEEGKYIRFEVVPTDTEYHYGKTSYVSEPVFVTPKGDADKTSLWALLSKVNSTLENAVVGTEGGQYDQESVDALAAARDKAVEVASNINAYQYQVNKAEEDLSVALEIFLNSVHDILSTLNVERISLKELLDDQEGWKEALGSGIDLVFEDGSMCVAGNESTASLAVYNAKEFKNTQFSFKMKAEIIDPDFWRAGDAWVGIYLRQLSDEGFCWGTGKGAAMFDLKQQLIQYQQWPKPASWTANIYPDMVRDDKMLEMGKTYDVTIGVYDTDTEGKIIVELIIDGNTVYSDALNDIPMYGTAGMFAISAGVDTRVTLYPADVDLEALENEISSAEKFISGAVAGKGYGEYPQSTVDSLKSAIADAKTVLTDENAVQYNVDQAATALRKALISTKNSFNQSGSVTKNGTVAINYSGEKAEINIPAGVDNVTIDAEKDKFLPIINAASADSELSVIAGTIPSGSFNLPLKKTGTSKDFVLGDVSASYGGASYASFNQPVRVVLKGEGAKLVAYLNEKGSYTAIGKTIKEDSMAAAEEALTRFAAVKMTSGNDLIIYTYALSEFVTYTKADSQEESGSGSGSGSVINSQGNYIGGTSGSFFEGGATINSDTTFTDIVNHWAKDSILEMFKKGIVSGVSKNKFEPDRAITRAEFVTLAVKALDITGEAENTFSDVSEGDWFAENVALGAKAGLITGYDGKFRPNDPISRQEMVVVAVKMLDYAEKKYEDSDRTFADWDNIGDWAKPYIKIAVGAGIISGMPDGSFAPENNATRAEAVVVLKGIIDKD